MRFGWWCSLSFIWLGVNSRAIFVTRDPQSLTNDSHPTENSVEMPRPTVAPLVVGLGTTLLLAGFAIGPTLSIVGAVILVYGSRPVGRRRSCRVADMSRKP